MQAHIQASPLDVVSTEFAESKNEKNEKRVARKCLALCSVVSLKSVSVSGGCFNIHRVARDVMCELAYDKPPHALECSR